MDNISSERREREDSLLLTRRQFLQALAAAGASIVLPAGFGEADATQVNAAWERAIAEPWQFEVGEFGTIVDPEVTDPEVRADVFDVWDRQPRTPEHLIAEVEQLPPLQSAFQNRCMDRYYELVGELEDLEPGAAERDELVKLIAQLSDQDDGWKEWVRHEGTDGIDRFWDFIDQWLAEPVDWNDYEYFPRDWSGQGRSYAFFLTMDRDVRDELGVVIVEGDCPGSDYFAAELRNDLDAANAAAQRLGLPFRFRAEGASS